jgi:hypothetical protein
MREITHKPVQIHFECFCGFNEVYTDFLPVKWKDLAKHGIMRKKDKKTGKPFLLLKQYSKDCSGHEILY